MALVAKQASNIWFIDQSRTYILSRWNHLVVLSRSDDTTFHKDPGQTQDRSNSHDHDEGTSLKIGRVGLAHPKEMMIRFRMPPGTRRMGVLLLLFRLLLL